MFLSQKSIDGFIRLRITFPDDEDDDFAMLKPLDASARTSPQDLGDAKSCILIGNLLHDSSVLVTVAGACPLERSFEVTLGDSYS